MSTISTSTPAPQTSESLPVPVKLSVLGEFRRFNVSGFENLRSSISAIIGHDSFVVKYTDSDGDEVSVTNEAEFAVASAMVPAAGVLRVNVASTKDADKKAAKRFKKASKRQRRAFRKQQKKDAAGSESSESDDSSSSESVSASASVSDSSDSSEEKPKREKPAKHQKKALKKLHKHEKKLAKKKAAKPPVDSSDSSSGDSSAEVSDSSRSLEELKAQVARLAELHKKQKADRKSAKQAKKLLKKSKPEKKCRKHSSAATAVPEADTSSSSAEEIVSSESSPSSSEEKKAEAKARKQEMKKDGKVALKALKDSVREAKQRLDDAKKNLHREMKSAKAEMKLKEDARFVSHVTYPDPATVEASQNILKTFRFRNSGNSTWAPSTKLLLVSRFDNSLGAPDAVEIGREVKPEEEVDITVPLKAPVKQGQYDAFFRLALPNGRKFGQRVRSRVLVTPPAAPPRPGVGNGLTPAPVDTGVVLLAEASGAVASTEEPMLA